MKQPLAGIVATLLVMAIALGFISLFDFPTFAGWVGYLLLCIIPIQIVTAVLWKCGVPEFAGKQSQPMKGISLLDRKSTRLNSSHVKRSRMPSSA